ncbi:MAG: phosphatidate cytidylyltransferase [Tumebacillaceae bacterium]
MLYQRVLTGVIGGAVLLGAVWYGGWLFSLFICLLAIVGYSELVRMRGFGLFSLPALFGYLVTLVWVLGGLWELPGWMLPERVSVPMIFLVVVLFVFLAFSVTSKNRFTFQDMTYLFAGTIYVGLSFHAAMLLRLEDGLGLAYFLFLMIAMWTTDTFAYFVGRTVKGPKLWPAISPNKTVSGALGGVLGGLLLGLVFALITGHPVVPWMMLAVILSVFGQFGDFVESGLKRALDVKDSGKILPGHGGVLDRFDSLMFAAPIAYYGTLLLVS